MFENKIDAKILQKMNFPIEIFIFITALFLSANYTLGLDLANITAKFNSNQYNILYDSSNTSCNELQSMNVEAGVKCMMLCQQTQCKSVRYEKWSNICYLNGSNPHLIEYETLPGIDIKYFLG